MGLFGSGSLIGGLVGGPAGLMGGAISDLLGNNNSASAGPVPQAPGQLGTPLTASDVQNVYQQMFGTQADPGTVQSMLQYSNNGSVALTPFDVQQILQGTPQYQNQQLGQYTGQLQNLMQSANQRTLGQSQSMLTQQFAQQGRNIGSSGYLSAYANAAANLAQQQSSQLASFYGGGAQQIMANSTAQGNNAQGYGQAQQSSTLGFQRQQYGNAQQVSLLNQQNAYNKNSAMNQGLGSLFGGLAGAGIGAATGSPQGAMIGAGLGSQFGGTIGNQMTRMPNYSTGYTPGGYNYGGGGGY